MKHVKFVINFLAVFSFSINLIFSYDASDILSLDIDQLMEVQVETVNRYKENMIKAASAVYIITSEDIKRSGYTTLPEVFKIVPGMDVVRADSNKWGVTIRGFNGVFANKLMVLIDGINIYNHLFSGVFWDIQSIPLEIIDRIEIIRGASGTMWGANAVNGVINIITKKSSDMNKINFNASYGDNNDDNINLIFSHSINDKLDYTLGFEYQDFYKANYKYLIEEPIYLKGIVKTSYTTENNTLTFFTHIAKAKVKNYSSIPVKINNIPENIDVKGRYNFDYQLYSLNWTHDFSESNNAKLLFYYINSDIASFYNNLSRYVHRTEKNQTFTIDFQHHFELSKHNIIWGGEYKFNRDSTNKTDFTPKDTTSKSFNLFNFFISDKISLSKYFELSTGIKFEHYDVISKSAILSSIKLSYFYSPNTTFWLSFSNSARTPSSLETHAIIPVIQVASIPNSSDKIVVKLFGNEDFDFEKIYTYEIGLKKFFSDNFYFDIALFFNHYDDLATMSKGIIVKESNYYLLPLEFKNNMDGNVYGFELWSKINLFDKLTLSPYYSYCYIDLDDHNSFKNESYFYKNSYPTYKLGTRVQFDIPYNIKFDSLIFYKDALSYYNISDYTGLDIKIEWNFCKNASISLVGEDLLEDKHREFSNELISDVEKTVGRSIYFKINYTY